VQSEVILSGIRAGKRKWNSLIDKVYAPRNLQSAWERVKDNKGAAGVDGMTVARFDRDAGTLLEALHRDLREKSYRPSPVRRVMIPKASGGQRPLGIPTVRDRIVQQALRQILEPIFEAKFSTRSHGFRPERGCHTALAVVDKAVRKGYTWVVDADIQKFFDSVDHEKLIDAVAEEVADGRILKLIRQILQSGVQLPSVHGTEPTDEGTPQGGPVSPLLANIFLHAFDVQMVQAGYGLVRYADDWVVFAKSESEAWAALEKARQILEGNLGLVLHPEKTRVVSVASGFEFLGFHYFIDPRKGWVCKEVRRISVQRFRNAIRERTPRLRNQRPFKERHATFKRLSKNQRLKDIIKAVNLYLGGWHGYFKMIIPRFDEPFKSFDEFLRRRLRSVVTGRTGSGWWNAKIHNRMWRDLGLNCLTERHQQYLQDQAPATAR
jgi:RNA-directed DNA polymerase